MGWFSKKLDNDKGATRVLIHTDQGRKIFDEVKSEFLLVEAAPEELVAGSNEMKESVAPNEKRTAFFADALNLDGVHLFEKYFRRRCV